MGPNLKDWSKVGGIALLQAAILFISSGRLDWVMAWAYLGMYVGYVVIIALIVLPKNPGLLAERTEIDKEHAKAWDKPISDILSVGILVILLVAGLDMRFGWSLQIPLAVNIAALAATAMGYLLIGWAMASNKFFARSVCIQKEKGHTVATCGPYQFVRHPGYVGTIISNFALAPALGSLWGLCLGGPLAVLVVIRTALEDKTLYDELNGYREYAQYVRYRLLPGVW
jgi:protein-S-isoprenylcysteine O-methyltransferase Ste14